MEPYCEKRKGKTCEQMDTGRSETLKSRPDLTE